MRLFIDFETVDFGFNEGLGSGWAWSGVKVLGCSIKEGTAPASYLTRTSDIVLKLGQATEIVAHNAQYEAGIMHMLGICIENTTFLCTLLAAKLIDNTRMSYTLDSLVEDNLGKRKQHDALINESIKHGLVTPPADYQDPETFEGDSRKLKKYKTAKSKMKNLVYSQLDILQAYSPVVEEYCNSDVELTYELYNVLTQKLDMGVFKRFCKLINVTTLMRSKGVRLDIKATFALQIEMENDLRPLEKELWTKYGYFNYNSPAQVKLWSYNKLGLRGVKDKLGKESFGKEWLQLNEEHEGVNVYSRIKKLDKLISFCKSLIKYEKNGRIYPEMNIMEAKTGRFSCKNPNIQQIPSRDEKYAPKMRALFLPEEGENWYSLDFSSQEPRLQVHYAVAIGSESGKALRDKYIEDPNMDLYTEVSNMVSSMSGITISRTQSKILALALSYGMGIAKGAAMLQLSEQDYKKIRKAYFTGAPYLKDLNDFAKESITVRGYLYTLCRRKTFNEKGFEYKALNKLIQGGAFDQTAEAMIQCYEKLGTVPLSVIHDEINMSAASEDKAVAVQSIMENCVKLSVPSVADIGKGKNWGEAK